MSLHDSLTRRGLRYRDLFEAPGLQSLDQRFLEYLGVRDAPLHQRLLDYRDSGGGIPALETSRLLLDAAPHLEGFVAEVFGIEEALRVSREATLSHDPVLAFKKEFVLRRARRYRSTGDADFAALNAWLWEQLAGATDGGSDREVVVARWAIGLLDDEQANADAIDRLTAWCAAALMQVDGQAAVRGWVSFRVPQKVDHAHLVPLVPSQGGPAERLQAAPSRFRRRDGFGLTDTRMSARDVQAQVNYCVYCHDHEGDFCARGFPEKKGRPELGLKVDPLGVTLTGCPLGEKISEMHVLKRDGRNIAALAVAMADNPMVPATGHRICNDCMKACIYQKQDPVNIPQIETRVLTDVLALPWGVEIYDLLTRWNPLRAVQYLPNAYNGHKVLIAGMGPAGFTMAHHLTMEGCAVVGIDGLKIEPLPRNIVENPIRDWGTLVEDLNDRILLGFGGVAEYGITVRWDKNFLKLIYLTLLRRPTFQLFGGVRLGGTLTMEDAWRLGFDHVCIATGAGLPRVINIGNSLARGMRQASDFLMALQLTGAAKQSSLATLQVRLPAVVIGGGLTAIDTATEVQAYYVQQVEKVLARCEALGEERVRAGLCEEDLGILDEFLEHGRAVRAERARAAGTGEAPDFLRLIRRWGGVTLAYRKGMNASPAYLRNHEEILKATEEGIYYAEGLDPLRAELDQHQHIRTLVFRRMVRDQGRWLATRQEVTLPARSVFVAAGAAPNTIYEQEHPGTFELEGDHFLPHVEHAEGLQPVQVAQHCKAPEFGAFTSYCRNGRTVSFIGDTHPVFHGSVVKAIASSQRSYPSIMAALDHVPVADASQEAYLAFRGSMTELMAPQVAEVLQDNPTVTELWVRAPIAARNFRPGQFFRLQSFESSSPVVEGTRLQIPLLTVSGTGVAEDRVRLMVLQWGAGSRLVGRLEPGEPIVLMGPTGAPVDIGADDTYLVVAGRWGAAVMLDIGPALRAAGNRVLYVAAFGDAREADRQAELEAAADQIIWCTAAQPTIPTRRDEDLSMVAKDMVEVVQRYGGGEIAMPRGAIPLGQVNRLLVMGSTGLLRGFQRALAGGLKELFPPDLRALGTVGSPMQCMLKGVCAQCLQWQIDPQTGSRTRAVFSCAHQDQPLAWIDVDNLAARQTQNRLSDHIAALWVQDLLTRVR